MRRREFIAAGVGGVAAVSLGAAFWNDLFGSAAHTPLRRGPGYGPRAAPDAEGLRLPRGFRARVIARGGEEVPGTGYAWHEASDGAATFPTRDGGWILVSNSEAQPGGVSAVRFSPQGQVEDAYRILGGTSSNCSGGGTPWGTWLSCEEVLSGRVWECDPAGRRNGVVHPAMGVFKHEAAAVDSRRRRVYLTEDLEDGGLYRFTPERWPRLDAGLLEVARVSRGRLEWVEVPDPAGRRAPTREQVAGMTRYRRGEGIWLDGDTLYVSTTLDDQVHALDVRRNRHRVVYDGLASPNAPLVSVDQMTGSRAGEVFVCEDNPAAEIHMGVITRDRRVSRFLSVTGPKHVNSELTGACFDPSGGRMYFSSQRATRGGGRPALGAIYEVTGPFRGRRS